MALFPPPGDVIVVYEATSDFGAIAIRDILEANAIPTMLRSRRVPGYGVPTLSGDRAGIMADVLVRPSHEVEARAVIADYLQSLVDSRLGPDPGPGEEPS